MRELVVAGGTTVVTVVAVVPVDGGGEGAGEGLPASPIRLATHPTIMPTGPGAPEPGTLKSATGAPDPDSPPAPLVPVDVVPPVLVEVPDAAVPLFFPSFGCEPLLPPSFPRLVGPTSTTGVEVVLVAAGGTVVAAGGAATGAVAGAGATGAAWPSAEWFGIRRPRSSCLCGTLIAGRSAAASWPGSLAGAPAGGGSRSLVTSTTPTRARNEQETRMPALFSRVIARSPPRPSVAARAG
jgi:hypothetical protein